MQVHTVQLQLLALYFAVQSKAAIGIYLCNSSIELLFPMRFLLC
jgi:hypothetical protein